MNKIIKRKIHFVGIGGIGMSALAQMMIHEGHDVSGSDVKRSAMTDLLIGLGAAINLGHDAHNIKETQCVVYSTCVNDSNVELIRARELGLVVIHRSELLMQLAIDHWVAAVSGTHGKSTTTAMLGAIFSADKRSPTVVVGAKIKGESNNVQMGSGQEMIIEADESDSSFLTYTPNAIIITNIDNDHLDHFGDIRSIQRAFEKFVSRLPKDGFWVGCGDCPNTKKILDKRDGTGISYGFDSNCDFTISKLLMSAPGTMHFEWRGLNQTEGVVKLNIPGRHNVLNALGAIALAVTRGIDSKEISAGLSSFAGTGRRFDILHHDEKSGFMIVDDYAHHPSEVAATLEAALGLNIKPVKIVFQPHRYSRLEALFKDFAKSLILANKIMITDVYSASEKPIEGVTPHLLAQELIDLGHKGVIFCPRKNVLDLFHQNDMEKGLVIFMGAGDIGQIAQQVASDCKQRIPN